MPTYEYQCGACGAKFEQFQRMSDDPIKICPQCGESSVKRLMSTGVGVVFKGSGFYVTDYRDASYAKAESADHTPTPDTTSPVKSSKSSSSTKSTEAASSTEQTSTHHATSTPTTSSSGTAEAATKPTAHETHSTSGNH